MIYFYYGTDAESARKKARATADSLLAKKPDAAFVKIGDEEISSAKLEELSKGQALFLSKFIIYFYRTFENKGNKEIIMKYVKEIGASENIFIFAEGKMDKASLSKIEKYAEKAEEFSKPEKSKERKTAAEGKISFFEFADAFGRKDKKNLWVMFQDALAEDMAAEEIHSMLFWEMKNLLLAKSSKSAAEAGMSPFPYQKAKGYLKNFKDGELERVSLKLVSMYHEAHRGNADFLAGLEKLILEL